MAPHPQLIACVYYVILITLASQQMAVSPVPYTPQLSTHFIILLDLRSRSYNYSVSQKNIPDIFSCNF